MFSIIKNRLFIVSLIAVVTAVFLAGASASATAGVKTSTGNGNWENPGTWNPPGVPGPNDDVVVGSGHEVTVTDGKQKKVKSFTVQPNGKVKGSKGINIKCGTNVSNYGSIEGGTGGNAPGQRDGGDVRLEGGGNVVNNGDIKGGQGGQSGDGGNTVVVGGNDVRNRGKIEGGDGTTTGDSSKGNGGHATAHAAGGNLNNDGTIKGGKGANGRGGTTVPGGKGGDASATTGNSLDSSGTVEGGDGGKGDFGPDGKKGATQKHGKKGANLHRSFKMVGRVCNLQTDDGPMVMTSLAANAIVATNGPVTIITAGVLDLRGNDRLAGPRIVSNTKVLLRCDTVLMDPGVLLPDLIAPPPDVRKRTQVNGRTPSRIGQRYEVDIFSPDDPGYLYVCVTGLGSDQGIQIPDFGVLPVDLDPLSFLSIYNLPPFYQTFGALGGQGQSFAGMLLPPEPLAVGIELHTAALVLDNQGPSNLSRTHKSRITR